jgi:hypothetical protein
MDDCTKPYDCPGSNCCNTPATIDPFEIREDVNEWNNNLHLPIEGSTEDYNFGDYYIGFDSMQSSNFVKISCCHNNESLYMESPVVQKFSDKYYQWLNNCNKCGSGDVHITMHR